MGDANIVLAGGGENMSQAPFSMFHTRFGTTFGTCRSAVADVSSSSSWCSFAAAGGAVVDDAVELV